MPLLRWRFRAVWSDPARKLRTLESFAETEEDGGRDLELSARRVHDASLREHLVRHAQDEKRHAALFRRHAAELRSKFALRARDPQESDQAYDLSRGRVGHEVDAHGFYRAGLCEELGELAYVAMLHVAERRAARVFDLHRSLIRDDPELRAILDEILTDEKYHVAYTNRFLEGWRAEGRDSEVRKGLNAAKASRFLAAWRRVGMRSAAGFSQTVLFILYWTLLVPFGLIARADRRAAGWKTARNDPPARALERQY